MPPAASFEQRLKAEQDSAERAMEQLSTGLRAAQDTERDARMQRRQLQSQAVFLTGMDQNKQANDVNPVSGSLLARYDALWTNQSRQMRSILHFAAQIPQPEKLQPA